MADGTVSVRVDGPLEEYAASFAENLWRQGYRENTVRSHLHLVVHLSHWLDGQGCVRMSSQKGTTVIAQKGTTWERKRSQQ